MRRFSILCISVARTQNLLASIKHGNDIHIIATYRI